MKFHYYKDTDSLYIDFSSGNSAESREVATGVTADFDAQGKLVGLDIDGASKIMNLGQFVFEGLNPASDNR